MRIIDLIEYEFQSVEKKAFVVQKLLESFEETFDVDIRNGMSIDEE